MLETNLKKLRNALLETKKHLFKEANQEKNSSLIVQEKMLLLINRTNYMFSGDGSFVNACFERPKYYNITFLPCHLRDNVWLADFIYLDRRVRAFMSFDEVLKYVRNNEYFLKKREEYEQKIIKWQIMRMISDSEKLSILEDSSENIKSYSENIDYYFRYSVKDILTRIGMSREVIIKGIEINSCLWREYYMTRAFNCKYNPSKFVVSNEDLDDGKLNRVSGEFFDKWIRYRRYEYFQKFKRDVLKYGTLESGMEMTIDEARALKREIDIMAESREKEIREYKNRVKVLKLN